MTTLLLAVGLIAAAAVPLVLLRDPRTVPPGAGRDDCGSVLFVIPARNEADVVPVLLRSLGRLRAPPGEVVVVDDASDDQTAQVARAGGATVLASQGPPHGWTGKAWACQSGADASDGDVLVFLDADTELSRDALDGLLELHDQHGGLVSVQPFHRARRPYEQLSSYFNVVAVLASGAFTTRPARHPMAFGPCLVTSREDYVAAGGHAAVRGEILDDVRLAAAYHRAGLPVRCVLGGRSISMRMYPGGPRQLAEGWTKNIASGAAAAAPGPSLAVTLWLAAQHEVAVGTALALADVRPLPLLLWAVGWIVTAWQLRSVLHRVGTFRWWTWALFPVPLLAFDLVFARSAMHTVLRRSVRWRGRDVRLQPADAAAEAS